MKKKKTIQGVLPVLHMPYLESGDIDYKSLAREVDWLYEVGADGFCLAMVSDLLRLAARERHALSEKLVEFNRGRGSVIISVGAESQALAVSYAEVAARAGADAVMAIPPVSQAMPERALEAYFGAIAEAIDLPVIVQDASGYVGKAMSLEFQAGFFKKYGASKIFFKPEAQPIGPNLSRLRQLTGGKAAIFEGTGGIALVESYRRGITGTMPGTDLLDAVVLLWKALKAGKEDAIYRLYFPVAGIVALQTQAGLDGFIAVEKYLMKKRGIFPNELARPPFAYQMDKETKAEVDRLFGRLQRAVKEGV
jgi:4-hydroxy-tetrahydrodipicolinate synthase